MDRTRRRNARWRALVLPSLVLNYLGQGALLLGNPAAVVPVGVSPEGLPIGVQIVGRPWEEERVLAIAACVERAGGWKEPPLQ